MENTEKVNGKLIITPGLDVVVDDFIQLYNYLKDKPGRKFPIMILGERGVGKSLFWQIYRTIYLKDNPGGKVIRLNAASLMETLVDSELFGHKKGSFTGATTDKKGLVEDADLLILEEIGDIPAYVQAKLLTFLEDGKYRMVGGTKEETAKKDIQIIATTNKKRDDMRPDFYDRFIKFSIPALHERRVDIFYYILQFAPSILQKLRTWEIMSLLAHPWPGNVRELLAASMDMERVHIDLSFFFKNKFPDQPELLEMIPSLLAIKKEYTDINWMTIRDRYQDMKRAGVDVNLLEKLLNQYDLGMDEGSMTKPWVKKDFTEPLSSSEDDKIRDALLGTETYRNNIFSGISNGLSLYCNLFCRVPGVPDNLLSVRSVDRRNLNTASPLRYIKKQTDKYDALVKSILEYCFRRKIDESARSVSLARMHDEDYVSWIKKAFDMPFSDLEDESETRHHALFATADETDLTFYKNEDELIKAWYSAWIKKHNGKHRDMFKALGINEKTGYRHLSKLGIISHK